MLGWRAWEPSLPRTDATMQQSRNNGGSDDQTSQQHDQVSSKGSAGQLALRKSSVHSPAGARSCTTPGDPTLLCQLLVEVQSKRWLL